jgi:hypothetical protein
MSVSDRTSNYTKVMQIHCRQLNKALHPNRCSIVRVIELRRRQRSSIRAARRDQLADRNAGHSYVWRAAFVLVIYPQLRNSPVNISRAAAARRSVTTRSAAPASSTAPLKAEVGDSAPPRSSGRKKLTQKWAFVVSC